MPEEHIILDEFKDGAFRIAIEHELAILPMTFMIIKTIFLYFFSGSPGKMRAKIHPPVYTKGLTLENKNTVKHQVRELILTDLENDLT